MSLCVCLVLEAHMDLKSSAHTQRTTHLMKMEEFRRIWAFSQQGELFSCCCRVTTFDFLSIQTITFLFLHPPSLNNCRCWVIRTLASHWRVLFNKQEVGKYKSANFHLHHCGHFFLSLYSAACKDNKTQCWANLTMRDLGVFPIRCPGVFLIVSLHCLGM